MRNSSAARAVTLVELMVVMLIISIFASLAMPSVLRASRGDRLETTRDRLIETINFAYATAISRRRTVIVNLDSQRRACWVTVQEISLPWIEDTTERTETALSSWTWAEGTQITLKRVATAHAGTTGGKDWETICFTRDGVTDDIVIDLYNGSDEDCAIEIIGPTGEARPAEET